MSNRQSPDSEADNLTLIKSRCVSAILVRVSGTLLILHEAWTAGRREIC